MAQIDNQWLSGEEKAGPSSVELLMNFALAGHLRDPRIVGSQISFTAGGTRQRRNIFDKRDKLARAKNPKFYIIVEIIGDINEVDVISNFNGVEVIKQQARTFVNEQKNIDRVRVLNVQILKSPKAEIDRPRLKETAPLMHTCAIGVNDG